MWNPFVPRKLPFLARAGFRREFLHFALFGVLVGGVEGAILGAVAKKTFGAPDWLTSLIYGLPVATNIVSPLWATLLEGRRMRAAYLAISAGVLITAASIALVPAGAGLAGALVFACQVAIIHTLMTGLLTIRSEIWRSNYSADYRARATSYLMMVRGVLMLLSGLIISAAFDWAPWLYRLVFPLLAVIGLAALRPMAGLRVRGENRRLREAVGRGRTAIWSGWRASVGVLRRDGRFARYQVAQFLLGSANFFTDAALINIVLVDLDLGYFGSQIMMTIIPSLIALLGVGLWAGHYDRVGVVRFRLLNTGLWIASYTATAAAMLLIGAAPGGVVLALLLIGRLVNGACRGAGQLAWNLGHLHFSTDASAQTYMGIHVALTGVRGLLMPILAAACMAGVGRLSFLFPIVLCLLAYVVFWQVSRSEGRPGA